MQASIELRDPDARGEVEVFAMVYGQRIRIGEVEADTLRQLADGELWSVTIHGSTKNGGVDISVVAVPK